MSQVTMNRVFAIIGSIILVAYIIASFITGGIPELTTFRDWVNMAIPISCIPATALFVKAKWADFRSRKEWYFLDFFYIIVLFVVIVWALTLPGALYDEAYQLVNSGAMIPYRSIMAFAFLSGMIRTYVLDDWKKALLLIGTATSMFVTTPLGDLILPLREVGQWVIKVPGAAAIQVLFLFGYIALVLTVVRTLMMKERLAGV